MPKSEPRTKAPKVTRTTITPELKVLYLQALRGHLTGLSKEEQTIIVSVFEERFPVLKRESRKLTQRSFETRHPFLHMLGISIIVLLLLAIVVMVILIALPAFAGVDTDLNVASELQAWQAELKQFETRLTAEQQETFRKLSAAQQRELLLKSDIRHIAARESISRQDAGNAAYATHQARNVNADLMRQVDTARNQAKEAEFQAALTNEPQVKAYGYADKTIGGTNIVQAEPREIVMTAAGPGLEPRTTQITIVQPQQLPTPLPTPVPKQETRIHTTVNGINHVETRAVLPELLTVDQLGAVEKIADNGLVIAQQRFMLEQYTIDQDTRLEYFKVVKSFTLWGFLASIPFLATLFWIGKGISGGFQARAKLRHDYKLKELEISERAIYDDVPKRKNHAEER